MYATKSLSFYSYNAISVISIRGIKKVALLNFLKVPKPTLSLDSILNPPPKAPFSIRNSYIPLTRRSLIRELLQDSDTILPSERRSFEKLAGSLDRKLDFQFQILQNELSLLTHSSDAVAYYPTAASPQTQNPAPSSVAASKTDQLDREFWLLRRFSDIAPAAGFIEITQDQLESSCKSKPVDKYGTLIYIDPQDYDVLRFWIRGFHPQSLVSSSCNISSIAPSSSSHSTGSTFKSQPGIISRSLNRISTTVEYLQKLSRFEFSSFEQKKELSIPRNPNDFCFGRVLMAVRSKNSPNLELKMFENVPTSSIFRGTNYADNLLFLLPNLRTSPLGMGSRLILLTSSVTALACLGLVSPMAWLLTPNPDLVWAWSLAATTSCAATFALVWARYWRGQTRLMSRLKELQYQCCHSSGSQTMNTLLKLAHEQEFKAALLTYALLLRPTEIGSPLSPVQLGIRAESWIAKRLTPKPHVSLPSSFKGTINTESIINRFTGGSGPLFDLVFNPERSLKLLRRLDLVRGPKDAPVAVPLDIASLDLEDDPMGCENLDRLWVVDPLVQESDVVYNKAS